MRAFLVLAIAIAIISTAVAKTYQSEDGYITVKPIDYDDNCKTN